MRKNQVQNIVIHTADGVNSHALADRVSEFHVEVIERRLARSGLEVEQQLTVIDNIIVNLQSREVDRIIK